jgi:hypothetical protein
VGIKMRQDILLDDHGFVARHRNGKLQYFHHDAYSRRTINLRHLRILSAEY